MEELLFNEDADYLLMLHGMGGPNPLNFIEEDLKTRYRIIKPTMFGFNEDDGEIDYSDGAYVEQIEDLRKSLNIEKWIVLGYSMGGRTAINYSSKYPDNVGKLIILDSVGIEYMNPLLKLSNGKKIMKTLLYPALKYGVVQNMLGKSDFKDYKSEEFNLGKKWFSDLMKVDVVRKNFVEVLTSIGTPIENLSEKLSNYTGETLILWSEEDKTSPIKSGYKLKQMIKNSTMHVLPGYRHMAVIEKPDFYIKHIIAFINNY